MDSPDVAALLRGTEVFGQLDGRGLEALQRELAWFSLPGGQTLYEAGETSDALYVLKTGSLGVFVAARRGTPMRLAGVVAAGRTVGEIGMITGRQRAGVARFRVAASVAHGLRCAGAHAAAGDAGRRADRGRTSAAARCRRGSGCAAHVRDPALRAQPGRLRGPACLRGKPAPCTAAVGRLHGDRRQAGKRARHRMVLGTRERSALRAVSG